MWVWGCGCGCGGAGAGLLLLPSSFLSVPTISVVKGYDLDLVGSDNGVLGVDGHFREDKRPMTIAVAVDNVVAVSLECDLVGHLFLQRSSSHLYCCSVCQSTVHKGGWYT